ncbi:hypothetical protein [Pectobacterium cacticida]|uniref:hypothetical protein n=1 Tax=Pectobacterium cacticida TaxID=69221 RepID=UPI0039857CC8
MKKSDVVANSFRRSYSESGKFAGCIQTGKFKNGTAIGTAPCDGSICGGLSTCKDKLTGNAT